MESKRWADPDGRPRVDCKCDCGTRFVHLVGVFGRGRPKVRKASPQVENEVRQELLDAAMRLNWYFGHSGRVDRDEQVAVNFREAANRWDAVVAGYHPDDFAVEMAWQRQRRQAEGD